MSLTRRQRDLLAFIIDHQAKTDGVAPSFDEMRIAANLVSKSGVFRMVEALQERGFIARLPYRARSITVLKTPDGMEILGVSAPGSPQRPDFLGTSDAITRLYVHGLLTEAEMKVVRLRFLKSHGVAA